MNNEDFSSKLTVGNYISILYRIGSTYLSSKCEQYNIGFGQYQFLITLYYQDGLTQDELTKRISVDKATTARAISKLKAEGYVTVTVDEQDKRIHHVWLSEKAQNIKEEILFIAKEWEEKLTNTLTEEDKITMTSLFSKITVANGWIFTLENKEAKTL